MLYKKKKTALNKIAFPKHRLLQIAELTKTSHHLYVTIFVKLYHINIIVNLLFKKILDTVV